MPDHAPLIGVSADVHDGRARVRRTYCDALRRAGAVPVVLTPPTDPAHAQGAATEHLERLDALVLTGGDDPRTEPFGVPTDPRVTPVDASRQAYETALLTLATDRDTPVLGVCLGMQMKALCAGGALDQWMPDTTPTHADHWGDAPHAILPDGAPFPPGDVTSHHRQAVADGGSMRVIARAPDGVIEAIDDPARRFALGVQWHPERTGADDLGDALYRMLVRACAG
jgi:putative glutamine amidotransferase